MTEDNRPDYQEILTAIEARIMNDHGQEMLEDSGASNFDLAEHGDISYTPDGDKSVTFRGRVVFTASDWPEGCPPAFNSFSCYIHGRANKNDMMEWSLHYLTAEDVSPNYPVVT